MYKLSCEESHSKFEIFCEKCFSLYIIDGGKAGQMAALLEAVTFYSLFTNFFFHDGITEEFL